MLDVFGHDDQGTKVPPNIERSMHLVLDEDCPFFSLLVLF